MGEAVNAGGTPAGKSMPSPAAGAFTVFISYRRADTAEAAWLLFQRLSGHFGEDNVFFDVEGIGLGTKWLEEIKRHGARSAVVLALIGPTWTQALRDRRPLTPGDPDDYVIVELELALGRWPGTVIPVLIRGASMPTEAQLPRSLRALAGLEAFEIRHGKLTDDLDDLVEMLDRISVITATADEAHPSSAAASSKTASAPASEAAGPTNGDSVDPPVPPPDDEHYDAVLKYLLGEGTVVPLLGSGVRGSLPDADQLAAHLSSEFKLTSESQDLAEVTQQIVAAGEPTKLFRAIRKVLAGASEPTGVHDFLAGLPEYVEHRGLGPRYQMIVTTSYDTVLERAFEAKGEPYDLAVFLVEGDNKGKFVHIPWKGDPQLVTDPRRYRDFPIDGDDELEHTLIVRICGAEDGGEGQYRWERNFLLTEDQYIDYLVADQVASVLPHQILNKLTGSHCLFLGYRIREWTPRVFLKRVWRAGRVEDVSWAIERAPDRLEERLWKSLNVELAMLSPDDYASQLAKRADAWQP